MRGGITVVTSHLNMQTYSNAVWQKTKGMLASVCIHCVCVSVGGWFADLYLMSQEAPAAALIIFHALPHFTKRSNLTTGGIFNSLMRWRETERPHYTKQEIKHCFRVQLVWTLHLFLNAQNQYCLRTVEQLGK